MAAPNVPDLDRLPGDQPPPAAAAPDRSGLWYMAQAAFWFSLMSLFVKLAAVHVPALQVVFVRACITLLLSASLVARAPAPRLGHRRRLLLLRGLLGSGGLVCFYLAVIQLPLAEATVIHQTSPLFTALLAALVLGERLEGRVLASIAMSLAGVLLIARPDFLFDLGPAVAFDWQFALVGLCGSILSAGAYVTVRRLGATEHPLVVVLYFPLVTVPLTAAFALPQWVWPGAVGWLLLLGVGVTTQIAQVAMTKGLARERAGRATSVGYLQVAFATLLGALCFGVVPDALGWVGMAVIVASLLLGARRS